MSLFDTPQTNNFTFANQFSPQFDPIRFKQGIANLDQNALQNLVMQARNCGIPDAQIQSGLNYILSLK